MTEHVDESQALLEARLTAFKALENFLTQHGPIDTPAKQTEFDRLRAEAEPAVQAFDEALVIRVGAVPMQ